MYSFHTQDSLSYCIAKNTTQQVQAPKRQQSLYPHISSLPAPVQTQYGLWVHRCQEHWEMAGTSLGESAGLKILGKE